MSKNTGVSENKGGYRRASENMGTPENTIERLRIRENLRIRESQNKGVPENKDHRDG